MTIDEVFEQLARDIEISWASESFKQKAFPAVAQRVLEKAALSTVLDPLLIHEWVLLPSHIPDQIYDENDYGQPTITVARNKRFRIEVIFWFAGMAGTHQHISNGAFAVLSGKRIHNTYEFNQNEVLSPGLKIGHLKRIHRECIGVGDVRQIISGPDFIHDLAFFDEFCVTVSVRSANKRDRLFYAYYPPHLAICEADVKKSVLQLKQLDALSAIRQRDMGRYIYLASEMIKGGEIRTAILVLLDACTSLPPDEFARLLLIFERKYVALASVMKQVAREAQRRNYYESRMQHAHSVEQRFVIGLLWSGCDASNLADLVVKEFPEVNVPDLVDSFICQLPA